jgi:hypothetical protein
MKGPGLITTLGAAVLLGVGAMRVGAQPDSDWQRVSQLGSGRVTERPQDPDWQTYRNDRIGFEVQYPSRWTVVSGEPHYFVVTFNPPSGDETAGFSVGLVQPIRNSWFLDFNQWLGEWKAALADSGSTLLSEEPLTVSGYPALRLTYNYDLFDVKRTAIDVAIGVTGRSGGQVFTVAYQPSGGARDEQEHRRLYERVTSTLKIFAEP